MIRTLLATTAIATLLAGGAVAQTTTTPSTTTPSAAPMEGQSQQMTVHAEGHLASNLIGEAVYNSTAEDAENIGDVTDLVINDDGTVEAIVVGVGGFLGIGQKEVALQYDLVQWSEQQDGERWLVVETTEDALRAQQEFDRSAFEPMPADAQVSAPKPATQEDLAAAPTQEGAEGADTSGDMAATAPADDTAGISGDMATAPADDTAGTSGDMAATAPADDTAGTSGDMAASDNAADTAASDQQTAQSDQPPAAGGEAATDQTQTGAIDRNTLNQAAPDQIRAENLTGTAVYGANDERVGEIGDVVLTPEGDVDAAIVDVGGFLGIGEKEVAIGMDNLVFQTDDNGELYLFTDFTQDELEAQPAYDEATYAENRDQMRMRVQ
ncbi:PRC-barrel domain-containing protein [Chelativorans sp. AA-79]|uniref:PRC-barrel domain-containing protein n=1 Tax=Chelativorans sp. AA-79 TaxID=3028735 RepID=UPI0023F7A575|nr:PRC-barrel domain-containing protein [Chelativorans sp. AA-79]WEX10047.1 PRC-barrel domain-containing protein [Chelativorans sp. AA-79]